MLNIENRKFVYNVNGQHGFDVSHCHKPTPLLLDGDTIRVYFGVRDANRLTRTTFIDVDARDPSHVKYIHPHPVLDLGKVGAFDDCGANVCSVLKVGNEIWMYFIGWNPGTTVHTRNAVGLAISTDGGWTFKRVFDGAVFDRNATEPYYTGAVDVLEHHDRFSAWYTSGSEWKIVNNKPEIFYHIKYASSKDGMDWSRKNDVCIPPDHEYEATARPSVRRAKDGKYLMLYSRRDIRNFRTAPTMGYSAGYATSDDGKNWIRRDNELNFPKSSCSNSWDCDAIAYPFFVKAADSNLVFYNGNGFGASGFGYGYFTSIGAAL